MGLAEAGLVCQKLKTYWKGRGRILCKTFLCKRLDERVLPPTGGLDVVFSGEVRATAGAGDAMTDAIEGYSSEWPSGELLLLSMEEDTEPQRYGLVLLYGVQEKVLWPVI